MAYAINNWDEHFESAYSRRIKNKLGWVPMPTSHDGKRYYRLTTRPMPVELFGAWCLMVEIAAKMPTRGVFIDSQGEALDAQDFADLTKMPVEPFERALAELSSKRIGWIIGGGETLFDLADDSPDDGPPPTSPAPRKRDEIFDAIAEADGFQTGAKIPPQAGKRIGSIAAELRAKGADAAQIRERWAWIKDQYPNATTHALSKHWDAAGREVTHRPRGMSPARASADANVTDPRDVQI